MYNGDEASKRSGGHTTFDAFASVCLKPSETLAVVWKQLICIQVETSVPSEVNKNLQDNFLLVNKHISTWWSSTRLDSTSWQIVLIECKRAWSLPLNHGVIRILQSETVRSAATHKRSNGRETKSCRTTTTQRHKETKTSRFCWSLISECVTLFKCQVLSRQCLWKKCSQIYS